MGRDNAPALVRAHPAMALPADAGLPVAAEFTIRRAEIATIGHDPELQQITPDDGARVPPCPEGGDLIMPVKLLSNAIS